MRQRLMRMLLLAGVGFVGRQIQKKLKQGSDGDAAPAANPTAAPFEAHVEGDSVQYEPTNPVERDPKDPDEPFGGSPVR